MRPWGHHAGVHPSRGGTCGKPRQMLKLQLLELCGQPSSLLLRNAEMNERADPADEALGKALGPEELSDRSGAGPGGAWPREDGRKGRCLRLHPHLADLLSPAHSPTPVGSALRESASALVASGSLSSPFPAESARRALCRNMAQFELTLTWGCLEKRKQCSLRESGWASSAPTLTGLCPLWVSAFILIQCRGWGKSVCTNQRLVRAQGFWKSSFLLFSGLVLSDSL